MAKRARKICKDCGEPYNSMQVHKEGASSSCAVNKARKTAEQRTLDMHRSNWSQVGQWHATIGKCDVPIRFEGVIPMRDGSTLDRQFAPRWVMSIVTNNSISSYDRALVVNYLFANDEERRFFVSLLSLQANKQAVRACIREAARKAKHARATSKR